MIDTRYTKSRKFFNTIRFGEFYEFFNRISGILPKNPRILYVGCGKQIAGEEYPNPAVFGIDIDFNALKENSIKWKCKSKAETLPFKTNSFDLIVVFDVLHHVENLEDTTLEIHRCLNKGKYCIIADTTENNPIHRFARRFVKKWRGMKIEQYFYHNELKELLAKHFVIRNETITDFILWLFYVNLCMWKIPLLIQRPFIYPFLYLEWIWRRLFPNWGLKSIFLIKKGNVSDEH